MLVFHTKTREIGLLQLIIGNEIIQVRGKLVVLPLERTWGGATLL